MDECQVVSERGDPEEDVVKAERESGRVEVRIGDVRRVVTR